jgi:hypothetical protein
MLKQLKLRINPKFEYTETNESSIFEEIFLELLDVGNIQDCNDYMTT